MEATSVAGGIEPAVGQRLSLLLHHALQELQRRCETLIRLVEKENEDLDARDGGKGKPKAAASKGAGGGSSSKGDASRYAFQSRFIVATAA